MILPHLVKQCKTNYEMVFGEIIKFYHSFMNNQIKPCMKVVMNKWFSNR